jgi:hypothetical protein
MASVVARQIDRVLAAVPGWLVMLGGLVLLAVAMVVPLHQETARLAWRGEVMQQQLDALVRQRMRYEQFLAALEDDDPVLLSRLAYAQWRYQPAEASLLPVGGFTEDASISRWLAEPMPALPAGPPTVDNRLTRLTDGRSRLVLLITALLCIVGGLLWRGRPDPALQEP